MAERGQEQEVGGTADGCGEQWDGAGLGDGLVVRRFLMISSWMRDSREFPTD